MEWFGNKNPQLHKAGGTLEETIDQLNAEKTKFEH